MVSQTKLILLRLLKSSGLVDRNLSLKSLCDMSFEWSVLPDTHAFSKKAL